jgi:PDZ domain
MLRLSSTAALFAFAGSISSVPAQEQPKSTPQLIKELGSNQFRDREAAEKALRARDEAYPYIRRALPDLSLEAQRRANSILRGMEDRRTKRFVQYGRERRVDLLVEWSSLHGVRMDAESLWQCVLELGLEQLKRSGRDEIIREWEKDFPARNYADFLKKRPRFIKETDTLETARLPTHLTLRSKGEIKGEDLRYSLVVSTGPVDLRGFVSHCILVTTGDVKIDNGINVLVITDGDVQIDLSMHSVIAARGTVSINLKIDHTTLAPVHRGGSPDWSKTSENEVEQYDLLYRPGQPPRRIYGLPSPLVDEPPATAARKQPVPQDGLIRFFEPADVGLKLSWSDTSIQIEDVQPGSPPAKAGIRAGDILTAIDRNSLDGLKSARQQLRRAFVLGGAEITVSRQGKPLIFDVSFFGWDLP